jgi:phosphoglycolate phosphatase
VLVLLDLDGTLTDPYDGITRCVSYALEGLGLPRLGPRELRSFIGPPLQDQFASLGLDESEVGRAVALYRERFRDVGQFENRVYDGIPEALDALAAVPLRLAVATSKPTLFAQQIVEHFGLDVHLDLVAGATLDGSRRTKADVIQLALTTLAAAPGDAVMVGDREQDVVGARTVGLSSIGVTWGYAEPGELETAGADQLAATPQELVDALVDRHGRLTGHTWSASARRPVSDPLSE